MTELQTREGMELVARIEARAMEVVKFTENPREKRDSVAGFRRFSTMLDDFHQAAEIAEARLTLMKSDRRDDLRRYVTQIRAKILKIEIDVMQSYLETMIEAQAPLPFGARELFQNRIKRLGELSALLSDGPQADGGVNELILHIRRMLETLMENAPQLEVFERAPDFRMQRSAPPSGPRAVARAEEAPPPRADGIPNIPKAAKVVRLEHKDSWGRIFLDKNSFDIVTQVCRTRNMTLDQVATRLGITRVALTLILNGQDAIQRNSLDVLHRILNGGHAT